MADSPCDGLFETSVGWFETDGWIDHLQYFDPDVSWYYLKHGKKIIVLKEKT